LKDVKQSRIVAAVFAGVLAAAGAVPSQAQVAAGLTVGWGWSGLGPVLPYRTGPFGHGWFGPWPPCGAGGCIDDPFLRRAIQRELAQFEHLRELEERAQRDFRSYAAPLHGARSDWPPPTPEAQVQPAFRGSGEIRPEFSHAGQLRQDSAVPPR
jgi:hypothetical protein